ncbi:unnamed protein product [Urochloa decumbens]|uniref:CCHC-type domain-containing protein n=1 Tax=Urochloa decumbens TaxID=240449 RepID=A0ABC8XJ23_9POAL
MREGEPPAKAAPPCTSPAAAQDAPAHPSSPKGISAHGGAAGDKRQQGRVQADAPLRRHDKALEDKGKAALEPQKARDSRRGGDRGVVEGPLSYRDAMVRPRTFKPRFPASCSHDHQQWFTEHSLGGGRRDLSAVWSRPGRGRSFHDGDGGRLHRSYEGGWLRTLRAKAGKGCFNCLSSGHFIADCRDPPRCLLCFRFGHKAGRCPSPPFRSHTRFAAALPRPAVRPGHAGQVAATTTTPAGCAAAPQLAARAPPPDQAVVTMGDEGYVLFHRVREERPDHVVAGARRTDAIREAEAELETFAMLAVQVDAGVRLDTERVRQEAVRQFRVPVYEVGVTRLSAASFLLRFDSQHQRDSARRLGALRVGHVRLQLLPWKRQVGARAELFKFYYQVRVCIEGVPAHGRHPETVAGLFPKSSFVDDLDCDMEKPQEEECYRLWIWASDPAAIATTGTLRIEETVTLPQVGYAEGLMELGMPMGALRWEPAKAMEYEVLIHVDRVLDYSPLPPSATANSSYNSPVSGHSDEEPEEEWPVRYPFDWRLGVPDGEARRVPARGRVSVHDRLGGRRRDRSPPAGGGGGAGLGLRQLPPSGPHDLPDLRGRGGSYFHGSSSRQGGGRYQHRHLQGSFTRRAPAGAGRVAGGDVGAKMGFAWRPKQHGYKGRNSAPLEADQADSFLSCESLITGQRTMDPMDEEAAAALRPRHTQPAGVQCSVEPTAPVAGLGLSALDGKADGGPDSGAQSGHLGHEPVLQGSAHADLGSSATPCLQSHAAEDKVLEQADRGEEGARVSQAINADAPEPEGHAPTGGQAKTEVGRAKNVLGDLANLGRNRSTGGDQLYGQPFDLNVDCNWTEHHIQRQETPAPRMGQLKKNTGVDAESNTSTAEKGPRTGSKQAIGLPVEERATKLLLVTSGIIGENDKITDAAEDQFGEQFVQQMDGVLAGNLRKALGLPIAGEPGSLDGLALDAEE